MDGGGPAWERGRGVADRLLAAGQNDAYFACTEASTLA
jgi:hypothetical protein